jgi:hypothetical protein
VHVVNVCADGDVGAKFGRVMSGYATRLA